jgi:predicted neuraminidase
VGLGRIFPPLFIRTLFTKGFVLKISTRWVLALSCAAVIAVDGAWRWWAYEPSAQPLAAKLAESPERLQCTNYRVVSEGLIPMPEGVPAAHASSLVALPLSHALSADKTMAAFWFAGTRESAPDVQIAASTYDRKRQAWDKPQWVVNRHTLGQALGIQIRRIGNPVAWADATGRLHLFVVATGLGGWAASRVVHLVEGAPMQFEVQRTLPLMPLVPSFNTSTLVRTVPLPLADGGAVLPLYFEIGIKYGMALRLDAQGREQSLTRLTKRHDVLQPTLVAHNATHWSALMRDYSPAERVAHAQTWDAGAHWQDSGNLALSNPGSSVAALRLQSGDIWMAHNPAGRGREVLLLSTSSGDELAWTTHTLVDGVAADEYSYPTLIEVPPSALPTKGSNQPDVWLSYTHMRKAIAYKQLRPACSQVTP